MCPYEKSLETYSMILVYIYIYEMYWKSNMIGVTNNLFQF